MKELREIVERRPDVELDGELPPLVGTFLRGLSLGALVGAAIAGSLLLRRRSKPAEKADQGEPASTESDVHIN